MSTSGSRTRPKGEPRPRPVRWTERARQDLIDIGAYIAQDKPEAAERWVAKLIATAERAAFVPLAGRVVPERAQEQVREVFLRSYRVVYRVLDDAIEVLTVFEGHRRFPEEVLPDEPS